MNEYKKMNIVLVNPPRDNLVKLDLEDFVDLGDISSFPPIGLMYLAQGLRNRVPDADVTIIDSVVEGLDFNQIAERVNSIKPDVVGITATTYTFYDVLHTALAIKSLSPDIPVAVGGSHMYIFSAETMSHACFDYGIVGDGEDTFTDLCLMITQRKPFQPLPGLMYRTKGEVAGEGVAVVEDLDSVRIPAVDLIDATKYYSTIGKKSAVGTICTTRGCPFHCTFCQVPRTQYRSRSIDHILDEIEWYLAQGISDFFFFDDLFNVTKKRVAEFSERLMERNLNISWMFRGRVDQIDDEVMRIAKKAGCHTVSVGIEDSTDEGLKQIKKRIEIEQAFIAVKAMRKNKIRSSANWIIGFPHHRTQADLDHLLKTAMAINSDYAQFSILQCLPGSELYDQAVAEGGIDDNAWRNYVLAPVPNFSPPIWEKHFSKQQLYDFYTKAYRKYYMRPGVVFKEVLAIRNLSELMTKTRSFFKIFLNPA
jgi:radical SAM superfamily enzyme YgiQ (UPF0313 family)